MYDNGLLSLYKKFAQNWQREVLKNPYSYNGNSERLSINSLNVKTRLRVNPTHELLQTQYGRFYVTDHSIIKPYAAVARCVDRQILLSQIYSKIGLNSAIYTPATEHGERQQLANLKTISNDVITSPLIVRADKFWSGLIEENNQPPTTEPKIAPDLTRSLTSSALLKQTKMRIYDVASHVEDRTPTQYFYKLQSSTQVVAEDVIPLQSGYSSFLSYDTYGYNTNPLVEGLYYSDTSQAKQNGTEVITETIKYQAQNELISPHDMAEEIGSINPYKIADDIEDNTGYKIEDAWYLEALTRSYQNTAELIQNLEQ